MKKVFVIVLHFRGRKLTYQCLESLFKVKAKKCQIKTIVVACEPLPKIKRQFKNIIFIDQKGNPGFAKGNNVGISKALQLGADYVLLLNNDTTVDKNFVSHLAAAAEAGAGIVGPKIYFAPGFEYHQARYKPSQQGKVFWYAGGKIDWPNVLCSHRGVDEVDTGQYDQQIPTDFVSGCTMLIKKEVLVKIGLLDESYFLYLEDVEFCQRAKKAGFKVIYQPRAKIWHFNAGSSQVGGSLHDYFITRNRLLFGLSYADWRAKLGLFRESVRLGLSGRPWQKKAIRDFYLKKFKQGSWHD